MKRRTTHWVLIAAAYAAFSTGCAKQTDAEVVSELKSALAASCKENTAKSNGKMAPHTIQAYCECSAQNAAALLGAERIRAIAGGEAMSPSDQQALQQAGGTCAVEALRGMMTETRTP